MKLGKALATGVAEERPEGRPVEADVDQDLGVPEAEAVREAGPTVPEEVPVAR
ncbi:hypothetical protein ACIHFC_27675 [Streptomyces sp. NPDC052013]|uniref:hypothetical protein n=1 Tax=Streptomyces sp. NPDC052013 TaxID=3365679 RepID=UPI0037D9440D